MKKIIKKIAPLLASLTIACVLLLSSGALFPGATSAAGNPNISFHLKNPLEGADDLPTFLANILDAVVLLLTPVVTIMLLYAGFLFVTAQGSPENLGTAKKALLYTLVGAAIVLGAKGLALIVQSTVGCLAGSGAGC